MDRVDSLQIQIDRIDCKLHEFREDQIRTNIDPKPLIMEQIDSIM